jgi:hypothetical protein
MPGALRNCRYSIYDQNPLMTSSIFNTCSSIVASTTMGTSKISLYNLWTTFLGFLRYTFNFVLFLEGFLYPFLSLIFFFIHFLLPPLSLQLPSSTRVQHHIVATVEPFHPLFSSTPDVASSPLFLISCNRPIFKSCNLLSTSSIPYVHVS